MRWEIRNPNILYILLFIAFLVGMWIGRITG